MGRRWTDRDNEPPVTSATQTTQDHIRTIKLASYARGVYDTMLDHRTHSPWRKAAAITKGAIETAALTVAGGLALLALAAVIALTL